MPLKILSLTFSLILLASAGGQTNSVFLEKRGNDWWAVWTNTPAQFKISTSADMVNWQVWISKHSGPPLVSFEMMLVNSNDFKFLKFEPTGYSSATSSMTQAFQTLTNMLNSRKRFK